MSTPLIERVPDELRDGLPLTATPALASRPDRRVLTDAETAALTQAGRIHAQQRSELLAEVGNALLEALSDGVLAP